MLTLCFNIFLRGDSAAKKGLVRGGGSGLAVLNLNQNCKFSCTLMMILSSSVQRCYCLNVFRMEKNYVIVFESCYGSLDKRVGGSGCSAVS